MDEELKKTLGELEQETLKIREEITSHKGRLDKLPGELQEVEKRVSADVAKTLYTKQQVDAELEARKKVEEEILKRQDELAAKLEKMTTHGNANNEKEVRDAAHDRAFLLMLRDAGGHKLSQPDKEFFDQPETRSILRGFEKRDMLLADDTKGGFLVPPAIATRIIEKYIDVDPVRTVAMVETISSGNEYVVLREKDHPEPENVGEIGTATEDEVEFYEDKIYCHPVRAVVPISDILMADAGNVFSIISRIVGRKFARLNGQNFISGNGIKKPFGIVNGVGTDATKYPATVTGDTGGGNAVRAVDFAKMIVALDQVYWQNARFMLNQTTLGNVMNLVTSGGGDFILGPESFKDGVPATLRGFPFTISNTIASEGADAYPIYFGDFREGYTIVDRSGLFRLDDPYTDYPVTKLKFSMRVGGMVVDPYAIKILVVS